MPLPDDVKALYAPEFSLCKNDLGIFTAGTKFKTELGHRLKLVMTEDGSREVYNSYIKAYYSYSDFAPLSLQEYAANFEVPEVPSLKEAYPDLIRKYREYVDQVYTQYNLTEFEFQKDGIALMLPKNSIILADVQGLGKSISSLVWMRIKRLLDVNIKRTLIIAPQNIIAQWQSESRKISMILHKLDENPEAKQLGNYIVHYGFIRENYEAYKNKFELIILEEAHKIKGDDSQISKAVRQLQADYKMILSGTPIKDILHDLHHLMGWLVGFNSALYPYGEKEQLRFRKEFGVYETSNGKRKLSPHVSNVQELKRLISPVLLRRTYKDIGIKMPKHKIFMVGVDFNFDQGLQYEAVQKSDIDPATKNYKLRCLCTLYPKNQKIELLKKLVNTSLLNKKQVIIYTGIVKAGEYYLEIFGDKARLVNGNVPPIAQGAIVEEFKKNKFPILIAGIEAMNAGHSLQNASVCIVTDYGWTSSTLEQAIYRPYRIVSKEDVEVYLLWTKGSVDEEMFDVIDNKRLPASEILDGGNNYEILDVNYSDLKI